MYIIINTSIKDGVRMLNGIDSAMTFEMYKKSAQIEFSMRGWVVGDVISLSDYHNELRLNAVENVYEMDEFDEYYQELVDLDLI